jgi:Uma2 family endonuclease
VAENRKKWAIGGGRPGRATLPGLGEVRRRRGRRHACGERQALRPRHPAGVGDAAKERATISDLEALPENVVGELIRGTLHVLPRPRVRHARAEGRIFSRIERGYDSTDGAEQLLAEPIEEGGPGGWWILVEPGISLAERDVAEIVPDVAGWRRERMPALPDAFTLAPDWVCEVLSPSTRRHDLLTKRPLYAEAGVAWMWIVDVDARTLTASRNHDGQWLELGVWSDGDSMRVEPFDQVELRGEELWGAAPPARGEGGPQAAGLSQNESGSERAHRFGEGNGQGCPPGAWRAPLEGG